MKAFGFSSPAFAKFCAPEHNIKAGCNSIRLGTLYSYRAIENKLLRDEGEGTFSYVIKFPNQIEVSPEWLSSFEFDGPGNCSFNGVHIDDGRVKLKEFSVSGSTPNCWIYCMSRSVGSAGSITDAHKDKWTIEADKLAAFVKQIANSLFDGLTVKELPANLLEKHNIKYIYENLGISADFKEVSYVDRAVTIKAVEDYTVSDIEKLSNDIAFIKPKKFELEQEIRIAFWLVFEGKKISIVDQPKLINLRPVDKFL